MLKLVAWCNITLHIIQDYTGLMQDVLYIVENTTPVWYWVHGFKVVKYVF